MSIEYIKELESVIDSNEQTMSAMQRRLLECDAMTERIEQLESLALDMYLTWKRLDLEGDWPTSGHNGWKTFEQRIAALGLTEVDE